jgi:hypothetical protein
VVEGVEVAAPAAPPASACGGCVLRQAAIDRGVDLGHLPGDLPEL